MDFAAQKSFEANFGAVKKGYGSIVGQDGDGASVSGKFSGSIHSIQADMNNPFNQVNRLVQNDITSPNFEAGQKMSNKP